MEQMELNVNLGFLKVTRFISGAGCLSILRIM